MLRIFTPAFSQSQFFFLVKPLLLVLICNISLVAQRQFERGSITKSNGQKIDGYISNVKDSETISFKRSPDGRVTKYIADSLKGYTYNNTVFKSALVSLRKPAVFEANYVFLETLVSGKINLYRFYQRSGSKHLLAEKNGELHELRVVDERRKSKESFKYYMVERKEYIPELYFLTQDCNKVNVQKEKPDFDEKELEKFILRYNNCNSTTPVAIRGKDEESSRTKLLLGLHIGNGQYHRKPPSGSFLPNNLSAVPINSTLFGAFVESPLARSNKNLFVKVEFNYYDASDGITLNSSNEVGFYQNMQIVGLITYRIRSFKVEPYASLGAGFKFHDRSIISFGKKKFSDTDIPYVLEVGANYKRFFVSGRFQTLFSNKDTFFYILGGYSFPISKNK